MTTLHRSDSISNRDLFTELDHLLAYERFPYNICDGCSMLRGTAYSSGHLVSSHFWLAYVLPLETNPFLELFVNFPDYVLISLGTFSILLYILCFLDLQSGLSWIYIFTDVNECDMDPCANNGTCINNNGSYSCDCDDGWQGYTCTEGETKFFAYVKKAFYSGIILTILTKTAWEMKFTAWVMKKENGR